MCHNSLTIVKSQKLFQQVSHKIGLFDGIDDFT